MSSNARVERSGGRGRRTALTLGAVALATITGCGSSDDVGTTATPTDVGTNSVATTAPPPDTETATSAPPEATPATTDRPDASPSAPTTAPTATTAPATEPELERRQIVALGEESLLADLLALGIEPIASSATVDTVGFQGIPDYDTTGIEVLPVTTLSVEYVASLQPEMIIAYEYLVDAVGLDVLEGMAETVVLSTGVTADEQITMLGDALDRSERAVELVAQLDDALSTGATEVADDCSVSVAAIYPGPSVAAFVDGPWAVPATIRELGCALDPDTDDAEPDGNGRAYLSLEQITILDAPQMILMQSDSVEGEQQSVEQVTTDPLWQQLPAVQADAVEVLDRLGYPGIEGRIRLADELTTILPNT